MVLAAQETTPVEAEEKTFSDARPQPVCTRRATENNAGFHGTHTASEYRARGRGAKRSAPADQAASNGPSRKDKKRTKTSAAEGPIPPMCAYANAEAAATLVAHGATPMGNFALLPAEILVHLFSFLSGKEICQLRCTSSELNRLGKDETLWKAICMREFGTITNRFFQNPFNKTWEWLYKSKAITYSSKDDIKDGAVCCYNTKECRYEGEWKNKELDGYGIELWADGEEYEGWSTQGRLNGYGRASYTSGDTYTGLWKNGLRAGGVYIWSDGWRYEGDYQDGKLTGRGMLLFKNGSKYTGQWEDGERHGYGVMLYFDGSRYEGEWKHDKREGRGILYWPILSQSSTESNSSEFNTVDSSSRVKHMRYEGFWRADQILEGGKVHWEDGTQLLLEEALKRLR